MHPRKVTLVLALSLAGTTLGAVPADALCAGATPRVSLTGFQVPEGPRQFFLGIEDQPAPFTILFAGGCNNQVAVDWATSPGTATPGASGDYTHEAGTEQRFILNDEAYPHPLDVAINSDGEEAIVESVQISLSNPRVISGGGSVTMFNSSIPILIVDSEGANRVGFEGIPYSQSETFATARIPVFRAGPASGSTTVGYTVEPGPSNPATQGEDYSVTSPPTLTFGDGDQVEWIDLSVVNDQLAEAPEDVTITLTGAAVGTPSSITFTILDNEENVFPTSRFHHPRHRWRYAKSDFRIREFHVFAKDEGGSGVVASELALRRNLRNGKCAWLTKSGWQKKDCQNREWLPTKYDEAGQLFYYRMKQLRSSVNTKIKDYTALSRAIDGAGNVEKEFVKKRNDNTFEIKKRKRRG